MPDLNQSTQVLHDKAKCKQTLEAYKLLIDFQKWAYDTHQRDSTLFLGIEVVLFGAVANLVRHPISPLAAGIVAIGVSLGMFLTACWAARQRRAFYMMKGRLERLKAFENDLPEAFHYFSKGYLESKAYAEKEAYLPIFGPRFRILPNVYRSDAFMKSIVLQQSILLAWALLGVFALLS